VLKRKEERAYLIPTATTGGYNYPGPYNRYEVFCYDRSSYITIGETFFELQGNYVASAASIGNYAIWTAGHCVHTSEGRSDGWSTNLVFVPPHIETVMRLGLWPASYLMARTAWVDNGIPDGLCEDMGGAILFHKVERRSPGVGRLGFSWNWSRYQLWEIERD
jgi:hypothetical protein